jgi:hypothetical protein
VLDMDGRRVDKVLALPRVATSPSTAPDKRPTR